MSKLVSKIDYFLDNIVFGKWLSQKQLKIVSEGINSLLQENEEMKEKIDNSKDINYIQSLENKLKNSEKRNKELEKEVEKQIKAKEKAVMSEKTAWESLAEMRKELETLKTKIEKEYLKAKAGQIFDRIV
jgi:predicted phage-related endonuclease